MSGLLSGLTGLLSLRSGPQDLPPAWPLTLGLIAAYLAASMTSGQQLGDESAAAKSLGVTALQFTAVAILLYWRRYPERLVQTLGALAGVGLVFALISWVLLAQVDEAVNQ
ncbi:MAG TPA: hypothetical protein VFG48_01970, partial [Xanthomonadales bacterium]|nr:hypothetical protein [Xanthomonadales bacterium]